MVPHYRDTGSAPRYSRAAEPAVEAETVPRSRAARALPLILKTLLFTVVAPGTVTVLGPYLVLSATGGLGAMTGIPVRFAGILPIGIGVAVYLWCAYDFIFAGRGTPFPPASPEALVTRGLYRHVRNPMYVGVCTLLLGEAALFASWPLLTYAASVWAAFNLFIRVYEEPTLRRNFGQSYDAYCRAVPRWVPRVRLP